MTTYEDMQKAYDKGYAEAIDIVRNKMISFYADAILRYGVNIIECGADAFTDLENWIKEQNNG